MDTTNSDHTDSRWLDKVSRIPLILGGLCLLAMMMQVTLDVAGKYLFSSPVPVTAEMVTYYYMVGVAMFPLYALERGSSLVHVEIVYAHLPRLLKHIVRLLSLALAAAYCFAVAYAAVKPALQAYDIGTYSGTLYTVITWPTRFFPIVGFGLLGLFLTIKAIALLTGRPPAEDREDEPPETGASSG